MRIQRFDIQTAGTVLLVVGILGLILSLIYQFYWARRDTRATVVRDPRDRY